MLYWTGCEKVILGRKEGINSIKIRDVKNTGQGLLLGGLSLSFFGPGGRVKQG